MSRILTASVVCLLILLSGPIVLAQDSAQDPALEPPVSSVAASPASPPAAEAENEEDPSDPDGAAEEAGTSEVEGGEAEDGENKLQESKTWLMVLWELQDLDLKRASLVAVAFLAAFLTVIGIWRIPSRSSIFTRKDASAEDAEGKNDGEDGEASSPFQTNFGRTVISGLTGMVAVTFLESYWDDKGDLNSKAYYLLWFVLFFVLMLFLSAGIKALNEAQRSRLINNSWRATWVILVDTFLNYIQGKNQSQTEPLTGEIKRLHDSTVDAADLLCRQLETCLQTALKDVELQPGDLRVAVSVLADDDDYATYIARPSGNLARRFPQKSLAWLALYSGRALWWKDGNPVYQEASVAFQPDEEKPLLPESVKLSEYFQLRGRDYNAFVVLPIPWQSRGSLSGRTRAGIHISFRDPAWMEKLWAELETTAPEPAQPQSEATPKAQASPKPQKIPNYEGWESMLRAEASENGDVYIRDEDLGVVLQHADSLLSALLRDFNLRLFEHFVPQPTARTK